jgi:hypothetical protein
MQWPKPGFNHVGEYQVSGLPFAVSGSGAQTINFPYVTQWIWPKSNSGTLTVAFTQNGLVTGNTFTVTTTPIHPLDLRVKTLYLSGSAWEIVAGLTMVEPQMMPTLSSAYAPGIWPANSSAMGFGYSGIG